VSRYPVRNGLALPIEEVGFERVAHERRVTTNHHVYWERASYRDQRHRQVFRSLLPHVVTMRHTDHTELHETYDPPPIPRDVQQIDVVDEYLAMHGVIDCVRECKTNETYQIEAEQWQRIKGLYRKV